MKILLLGDYSNFHPTLGAALAAMGHKVTVASDGCTWMDTRRAVDLKRPFRSKVGGALLFARMLFNDTMRGYDVVSIINPSFVTLRPVRLRYLFDRLRRHNGAVFLNACGTDKAYMDMLTSDDCPLPYTEFSNADGTAVKANARRLEMDRQWQRGAIADYCEYVYDHVDGVTTALYEYQLAMERRFPAEKITYTGIPIDLEAVAPRDNTFAPDGRLRLFMGYHSHRMDFKGTDRLGRAARIVADRYPGLCTLDTVHDLPYDSYVERLATADLVIDQLYSMTPATNALLAMARGQAVVSGAEPEYYDFIGERELHPVINARPDDEALVELFERLVHNPAEVQAAASAGRAFVARHNAAPIVAARALEAWTR